MLPEEFLGGLRVGVVSETMSRGSIFETISHVSPWIAGYIDSVLAVGEQFEVGGSMSDLYERALVGLVGNFLVHSAGPETEISCVACDYRTFQRISFKNETKRISLGGFGLEPASITICGRLEPSRYQSLFAYLANSTVKRQCLVAGASSELERHVGEVDNLPITYRKFFLSENEFLVCLVGSTGT